MYVLGSNITIGSYMFAGAVSVKVSSSWEMLTDTAEVTIPSNVRHQGNMVNVAEERLIKRGDKVSVLLGYDGVLRQVFTGFVDAVKSDTPVRIICQDETFLLKKNPVTISYKDVTLKKLLSDIIPDSISFEAIDVGLGSFRITDATPAKVLEVLKDKYGLHSWMRSGVLYSGFAYHRKGERIAFEFGKNIISDNLEYRFEDEIKLKAKAVSMLPDNSKIEIEVGDPEGELRTFHFYNITSEEELEQMAEEKLLGLRYTGYKGDFLAFGLPAVEHGDEVEVTDSRYDRSGSYMVSKVQIEFGGSGFRQQVTIDREA